ncbi:hypothetical protein scyTo_0013100 [Scyliorhinus torazame]|uniref:Uncharacterized protein n=1 Tax=Scyliorhinus torazame TaxID=75743 RepID=A0A401NPB4_SCYTO|nr:hypothetical protein [Scyliorhinus torazame]
MPRYRSRAGANKVCKLWNSQMLLECLTGNSSVEGKVEPGFHPTLKKKENLLFSFNCVCGEGGINKRTWATCSFFFNIEEQSHRAGSATADIALPSPDPKGARLRAECLCARTQGREQNL